MAITTSGSLGFGGFLDDLSESWEIFASQDLEGLCENCGDVPRWKASHGGLGSAKRGGDPYTGEATSVAKASCC